MYKPEARSKLYLLIFAGLASLLAWGFFTFYKPIIVESTCSDIAANSSDLYSGKKDYDPAYSFENLKERCIEEAKMSNTK